MNPTRRQAIAGAGGIALGAFGVSALSGSAAAAMHVSDDLNLEGTSMETARGEVAYLASGFQGYVHWENQPEVITHLFNRTEFNWDTTDVGGENTWRTLFEDVREVDNTAGRDWDTSESGQSGHFTNHIPNPDGSLLVFVEEDGTPERRGSDEFSRDPIELDPETEGNTWLIARDDDAIDRLEDDGAPFPYAFNRDYGLPPDPLNAANIPVPPEGDEWTLTMGYRKQIRLLSGDDPSDDEVERAERNTTFEFEIEHLDTQLNVTQVGQTAADG